MPVSENIPLEEQLKQLGFKNAIKDVRMFIKVHSFEFTIPQVRALRNESLVYQLQFEESEGVTKLKKYEAALQSVKIPKAVVNGINIAKLEKRLIQADKHYNDYYSKDKPAMKEETEIIESANNDVQKLFDSGETGREIAQLLMFKFWPEDKYKQYIAELPGIKANYLAEKTVEWNDGKILTAEET